MGQSIPVAQPSKIKSPRSKIEKEKVMKRERKIVQKSFFH